MNDILLDAFRHNSWATTQLLVACRSLSDEQLTSSAISRFGSILDTFNHIIRSDAVYLRHLSGNAPSWVINRDESANLDQLQARVEENERN